MGQIVLAVKAIAAAWAAFAVKHAVIAAIIKYVAATAISYGVSRALSPRSKLPSIRDTATEVNARDPAAARTIVYGQVKKSGIMYPVGTSGTKNEYVHIILILAGHECEELGDVYFNDEIIPLDVSGNATGRFAGYARIQKHLGTYNQLTDPYLQGDLGSSYWSNDHRLLGTAYLYIRLRVNGDLFANGIPEFWCLMKGRKLYDPRDGTQSATNPATWKWSQNAILAKYDWVRGVPMLNGAGVVVRNFGLGAPDTEINTAALIEAANIADETINLNPTGTEKRYTANGVVSTSTKAGDGIDVFRSATAGDCVCIGGEWFIRAGAYRTPTVTLSESDLRAPLQGVRFKPTRPEVFNVVKGVYLAPINAWQPADFVPVRNATYKTQDGGEDLPLDVEFPLTTSPATAQRLAKIMLERSRQGIRFQGRCKLTAFQNQATDVVQWNNTRFGWSGKPFEVQTFSFVVEDDANGNPYIGVDLGVRETASGVFDWANGEETLVDLAPNTTLPNPTTVATPSGLTLLADDTTGWKNGDGTWNPRLKVSWTATTDIYVEDGGKVLIEYKKHADSIWLVWNDPRGDQTQDFITDVQSGVLYDVRIRFENQLKIRGAYSTISSYSIPRKTTPSADATSIAAHAASASFPCVPSYDPGTTISFSGIVTFTPSVDNDVDHYEYGIAGTAHTPPSFWFYACSGKAKQFQYDTVVLLPQFLWLRSVNTSEVASAGVDTNINMNVNVFAPAGTISTQSQTAPKITGVKVAPIATSSAKTISTDAPDTNVYTTGGGDAKYISGFPSADEKFSLDISNTGFSAKPKLIIITLNSMPGSQRIEIFYDYDDAANSSSQAILHIRTTDATNLTASVGYRFGWRAVQ